MNDLELATIDDILDELNRRSISCGVLIAMSTPIGRGPAITIKHRGELTSALGLAAFAYDEIMYQLDPDAYDEASDDDSTTSERPL